MTKTQNSINFAGSSSAQFSINPPTAHQIGPNALDVNGAITIGSYAGGSLTAPVDGLIVSGLVGLNQPFPGYPLDVNGSISTLRVYSNATTLDNQNLTLAEGYDQGGFGGGSVGTYKVLAGSTTTAVSFNMAANVNSQCFSFQGGVFDGRYAYFVPSGSTTSPVVMLTRYDTTGVFSSSTSYSVFSVTQNITSNTSGFCGAVFDGRYVYYIPIYAPTNFLRYDTTLSFTASSSYTTFNIQNNGNSTARGFRGAVFDGRYIYFVPYVAASNGAGNSTLIRYDTTGTFTLASSYTAVTLPSPGFTGGTFDGRYVYLAPCHLSNGTGNGIIVRIDTTGNLSNAASFSTFNIQANLNSNARDYGGAVFDGRYIYFVPTQDVANTGIVVRYDTTGSFTASTSYASFDAQANVNSGCATFFGGVFDGRYVYFIPFRTTAAAFNGRMLKYDTTQSFSLSTSYASFNTQIASVSSNSFGFCGAIFDGRYIYMVPSGTTATSSFGRVTRIDTYPGSQATAMAASQAPNGFVIGSYTNFTIPPSNNLIVSGLVGIVTGSPGYPLDINGSIGAYRIYSNATTIDNQNISLAEGANQGGFGGGGVGTDKSMSGSTTTAIVFDTAANVNSRSVGFWGGVFDGRRVYLAPNSNGQITSYDTTLSFSLSTSYALFDTQAAVNSNSSGFVGAIFDGRYVYFSPNTKGQITRYDTTVPVAASTSYAVFNVQGSVNSRSVGFQGAIFDGRYVYFVPGLNSLITRYDTTGSFTANTSYATFDLQASVSSSSTIFRGGTFDGRYIYLSPSLTGQVVQYDTSGNFSASTSYVLLDTQAKVNSNSAGFGGAVFDGRFVYFIAGSTTISQGQWTRYDTTGTFSASTSYAVFSTKANVNSSSQGFQGGVFDGRYIYLVPDNNGAPFGQITRYDTTLFFTVSTSYSVFDTTAVNGNSMGFRGAVFDGRYIYLVPTNNGAVFGQITRMDVYPGWQETAIAASQATSFVVGSYAGVSAAPANGLIVNNQVGIGTLAPAYPLDVNGSISALRVYSNATTINNQNIALAEGTNQGGFGGGSIGTNKSMGGSATTAVVFNMQANVNSASFGFRGGSFDGRFLYFAPSNNGVITRYDTTASFTTSTNYTAFDTQANVNSNSILFGAGSFDGRYVYLAPSTAGVFLRYDTTTPFTMSTSHTVFDLQANVNSNDYAFFGAVFDGRYVYLIPNKNSFTLDSPLVRYDTTGTFTASTSYATFDIQSQVNSNCYVFLGGAFDGQYVYYVTNISGLITRYDTTGSFTASVSYATFDMQANVNPSATNYAGVVFDGRYIYFVPSNNGNTFSTQFVRYDTTNSFSASTSYLTFNIQANVASSSTGFYGGFYDGRYLYLCPSLVINDTTYSGIVTRYDTTQSFTASTSYSIFNTQTATVSSNSFGFRGTLFDGKYIYFVPSANGQITRLDAYPGPQATSLAASQAPNGFVVGSYAGLVGAPANSLIVSGQIGVGTPTPAYPLDINGSMNALRVYSNATTINNQNSALAEGYNQGGFGGGSVGTNKSMGGSTTTAVVFDMQANVNSSSSVFEGGAFDGRFLYFSPNSTGVLARYDTTASFTASTSYAAFDTQAHVNSSSFQFAGGVFDGRYVYAAASVRGVLLRYDTTVNFVTSTSYSVFNMQASLNSNSFGFFGEVFDGRYVYLVPNQNSATANSPLVRYDTTGTFSASTSYSIFNVQANVNSNFLVFIGGAFDGRYVYFFPNSNGLFTRYDTTGSFTASVSYATFNVSTGLPTTANYFGGAIFDGRYIYFVPSNNSTSYTGQFLRYDTTGSFSATTSYSTFNLQANVASSCASFYGGSYDGRYIYLGPNVTSTNTISSGVVARYDTTQSFTASTSYSVLNTQTINVSSKSAGFKGTLFDGKYVYFVPNSNGQITRLDAYPGPQATAIAASQAPNGFVVGSSAGTVTSPSSGLVVSSGIILNRTAISGSYAALTSDTIIGVASTSVTLGITLPAVMPLSGFVYIIMDESNAAGTNRITVIGNGNNISVAGATTFGTTAITTNSGVLRLISNGTQWFSW